MSAGELCNRKVVSADRGRHVDDVARLMREEHVGSVVIVDETERGSVPVGILTDRDIAVGVVAKNLDAATILADEMMSADLVTVGESDSLYDALRRMRVRGVRRVVVTASDGTLTGILTLDDVLESLAGQLGALARAVNTERTEESRRRV